MSPEYNYLVVYAVFNSSNHCLSYFISGLDQETESALKLKNSPVLTQTCIPEKISVLIKDIIDCGYVLDNQIKLSNNGSSSASASTLVFKKEIPKYTQKQKIVYTIIRDSYTTPARFIARRERLDDETETAIRISSCLPEQINLNNEDDLSKLFGSIANLGYNLESEIEIKRSENIYYKILTYAYNDEK